MNTVNVIETTELTKTYGSSRGITGLNLTVGKGEFFGFIGPNGAGKSTTVRTLLGLIFPSSGSAKVLGKDILTQKKEIIAETGYMPSETAFYSGMKVRDIIKLSAELRKKDCRREAEILCERLSLDTGKKADELSLGNKKKVSIVCALQHKPELCILDEPTSGLDPLIQKEFFDILKERNREGATIFFSSHVLSEVKKYCSRAAIIKEGKLAAADSIENLSKTNAKKIILHGISTVPEISNAVPVDSADDHVSFMYSGDIRELLKKIAVLPVNDISITDPDLEEIFMHYYEKDGE